MDRPAHFLPVLHNDVVQHRQAEQKPQRHLEGTRPVTAAVMLSRLTFPPGISARRRKSAPLPIRAERTAERRLALSMDSRT